MASTIFALSSGSLPSGVAIVRLSGPQAFDISAKLTKSQPNQRGFSLCKIVDPVDSSIVDTGLVLSFPKPHSFTGEDVVEFQLHGSVAVIEKMFDVLDRFDDCSPAEAGEFSRRAFENGLMDLTEIEGLADLIAAETEQQRRLAIDHHSGRLRVILDDWRDRLLKHRAFVEAELDFSDEEDVPDSLSDTVWAECRMLAHEIDVFLEKSEQGEFIRNGFRVVISGKPNVGKSSLLNALAKRDVAIVTSEAGTTRDIIDVRLNLGGYLVVLSDTAGIRDAENEAERIGVERSHLALSQADCVLHISDDGALFSGSCEGDVININSKCDLRYRRDMLNISTVTGDGLGELMGLIEEKLVARNSSIAENSVFASRLRQRTALADASAQLAGIDEIPVDRIDLRSEAMRVAGDCIGSVSGRIDVEDLLDAIFSEFCVGK